MYTERWVHGEMAHVTRVINDMPRLVKVWALLILFPAVQVIHRAVSFLHSGSLSVLGLEPDWLLKNAVRVQGALLE
jgi:hypothetical protein